jgi:hypothetical protein
MKRGWKKHLPYVATMTMIAGVAAFVIAMNKASTYWTPAQVEERLLGKHLVEDGVKYALGQTMRKEDVERKTNRDGYWMEVNLNSKLAAMDPDDRLPHMYYNVVAYKPGCPFGHCRHPAEYVAWTRHARNVVTRSGAIAILKYALNAGTGGTAATAPVWYIGVIKTWTSWFTTDTIASHAGWTIEATGTTDIAGKPTMALSSPTASATATAVNDTISAVTSAANITINNSFTAVGFYLEDSSTPGDTSATQQLYGMATFAGAAVQAGYTLALTITCQAVAGT